MARIDDTDVTAQRILKSVRNIGLGLLVVAAFTESFETIVRTWRVRLAGWEREGLSRVDSRASQIADVAMAMLEAAIPGPQEHHR